MKATEYADMDHAVSSGVPTSGIALCVHARRIEESVCLIHHGGRAGLVSQLTGLEKTTVKRLYLQLCGKPSPPGQMPFTDTWYQQSDQRMLQVSLIWNLHKRLSKTGGRQAQMMIKVFEAYIQLVREPLLDITRTVYVPQLESTHGWCEHDCRWCGIRFLAPVDHKGSACPACRIYQRFRCSHCNSRLKPKTKGRRRSICGGCGKKLGETQ